jgi:hypothetical protein
MSKLIRVLLVSLGGFLIFSTGVKAALWDTIGSGVTVTLLWASLPEGSIFNIVATFALWLLSLLALFGVIGFTLSGIMYLVSAGSDEMITKAKKAMMYSIVGVIVGMLGLVMIKAIRVWLTGLAVGGF